MKKPFIQPSIRVDSLQLNLFSSYRNDSQMMDGFLMNEVYAGSYSTYLPIIISDKRFKDDITGVEEGLERIMQLRPVSYQWKGADRQMLGLIAQDVKEIVPEAIVQKNGLNMIDYAGVVSLLVKAVQEQQKEIKRLKQVLDITSD